MGDGANVVVTINDLLQGKLSSLLTVLPLAGKAFAGTTLGATALFKMQMYGEQVMQDLNAAACKVLGGGGCFTAGTIVQTEAGPKPIEQVGEGDLVWAYNASSGQWEFDPVQAAYSKQYEGELVSITVGGDTVQMTADHPVYVIRGADLDSRPQAVDTADGEPGTTDGGRWISASDLRPGDLLRAESGGTAVIDAVSTTVEQTTVYSLTVENAHTFAVGADGLLVHNGCTAEQFDEIQKLWQTWFPIKQIKNADGTVTFKAGDVTLRNAGTAFENGGSMTATLSSGEQVTVNFNSSGLPFPDFTPFLYTGMDGKNTLTDLLYTGNRDLDKQAASRAAGFVRSDGSWFVPDGYLWHHTEGLGMQLVRTDVHTAIQHTGGFAIFKAGMRKICTDAGRPIPPIYK
jgi:hypothetical protein